MGPFYCVSTLLVLFTYSSAKCADCTDGFMSMDRMSILLDNEGEVDPGGHYQGIFPEVGFTCSGQLLGWVFGAQWEGNSASFTELQIWRPTSVDGIFTKVGNTTITTTESSSDLYYYTLSSPLAFQAGDVLGYYQPSSFKSQLRLLYEENRETKLKAGIYFTKPQSPPNTIDIRNKSISTKYQMFINVLTEPQDCGCGFMSVEKMKLLLDIDSVPDVTETEGRQQLNPNMRFTCNGVITKWIIGAELQDEENYLFPELQVWRQTNNNTYQKINGTVIRIPQSHRERNNIFIYEGFQPITFKSGDILGAFLPQRNRGRLRLLSEESDSLTTYYLPTASSETSPYDEFHLQSRQTPLLRGYYRPLISVEVATTASDEQEIFNTGLYYSTKVSNSYDYTVTKTLSQLATNTVTTSKMMISSTTQQLMPSLTALPPVVPKVSGEPGMGWLGVGIGVGLAVVTLLVTITATLTLYLQWRKRRKFSSITMTYQPKNAVQGIVTETSGYVSQSDVSYSYSVLANEAYHDDVILTQNVAYGMGKEEVNVSRNVAYSAAVVRDDDGVVYDYATTETGDQVLPRDNVPVSLNQAYIAAHNY